MEKKGLSLKEQELDVRIFKEIQEEHTVTEKSYIEDYRMDIEDRITDINLKKQAIAIVDLIESELEENERLQDEEYEQENEQFKPSEQEFYFLDSEHDDDEIRDNVPDSQTNYEKADIEPFEEPFHVLTAEEKEAMDILTDFNRESRERTYEGLENITSTTDTNQNTATLKATEGLNVAKDGLNSLKKGITSKIENVDAEKLDENWQNFWFMIWSILKRFLDIATVVVIAAYKIPAKRNYKKRLDYTVNEANGRFEGKNVMETAQNDVAYRFKVDWLPKIILMLSALFIYNEIWKLGWVTLGIGLVYYFITYVNFDYGGSNLLNKLADNMDKQGIRLKDSYFNNMIVLYRYFDEYQKALGVSIDERGKVEIYEDPELGSILTFYVNEDKNTTINSITDHKLTYYKVVPFLDEYNNNAKVQSNRQVAVMLDQILLMSIHKDENVSDLYAKKEKFWDCFPELKALAEQKRLEEAARLIKEEREKVKKETQKVVAAKGINENAVNVITMIHDRKRDWKFNVWNVSETAIVGNENYVKIRCIFNQNGNLANVKKLQDELESKFRSGIMIKEVADKGSFDLYVIFVSKLDQYSMKVKDLKKFNEKDEIFIGNSLTKPLTVSWNYQANHAIIAGGSGAGKSVEIKTFLVQLANLKSFDYKTMFITSSSKMADFTPFLNVGAAGFEGPELQEKVFTYILELLKEREREFPKHEVTDIKEYNEKYPENPMKQLVLVADEWENSRNGVDKKLSGRLETLLVQILNIARSSGCVVVLGGQSILKGSIGIPLDKMFIRFSGTNERNILTPTSTDISHYFDTLEDHLGVFFFKSKNTPPNQEKLYYGDTTFSLIQTPFITDIKNSKDMPKLNGQEFMNEILNGEINVDLDVQEVVISNLKDVSSEETSLNTEETNEDVVNFEL